jgi:hypothetical protein
MNSKLERKWWFVASTFALAIIGTNYLMEAAGIPRPHNFSQWTVNFFCLVGLQRIFSFAGWLLILLISPSYKAAK